VLRNLSPGTLGMLCMIAGGLLLTTQDAISKWLTSDYHTGEIMVYRGIFMLLPVAVTIWLQRDLASLKPRRPVAVGLRAGFTVITSIFVVLSFTVLPLADALAIVFLNPLLVTALSVPILKEAVGWRRWVAVAVGFSGMLLMTRPGEGGVVLAVVFPLTAALFAALRDLTTRRIGTVDTTNCLMFYSTFLTMAAGAVTLPFGTHWPSLADWGLFAAGGIIGGLSHLLTIRAFQIAAAAMIAPFKYLSLVWAAGFGYLLWGDVPDTMKVAGASLVVGSGLYILYRETMLARRARVAARA
jgi:drug/metabolite transporter (DMT)-like permease